MAEPTIAPDSAGEENSSEMDFDELVNPGTDLSKAEPSKEEKIIDEFPFEAKADDEPVTNGDHAAEEDSHEDKEEENLPDSSTDEAPKEDEHDTPEVQKQPESPEVQKQPESPEVQKQPESSEVQKQPESPEVQKQAVSPEDKKSDSSDTGVTHEKEMLVSEADSCEGSDKTEMESTEDVKNTESEKPQSPKTDVKDDSDVDLKTSNTHSIEEVEDKNTSVIENTGDDKEIKSSRTKSNEKDTEKKTKKRKAEAKEEELPTPKKQALAEDDLPTPKRRGARKSASVIADDGTIPVPPGWRREVVQRAQGASAGKFDVYYYSPLGKKLRSKVDVRNHCEKNDLTVNIDDFLFSQPKGIRGVVTAKTTKSTTPKVSKPATPKTPKTPGPKSSKAPKISKSEPTKKKTKTQGKAPSKERVGEEKVVKKMINDTQKKKNGDVKKKGNSYKGVGATKSKRSDDGFREKIYMKFAFKSRKSGKARSSQS